jgi:type II secretory pathway component PulC
MSIIYDALKKVERKFSDSDFENFLKEKKVEIQKSKPRTYLTYLVIIILGALSANLFYNFLAPTNKIILKESKSQETKEHLNSPAAKNNVSASNNLATAGIPSLPPAKEKNTPQELSKAGSIERNNLPLTEESQKASSLNKESVPSLILNGIFFSKDDSYALINNQILREGESIEGLLVKKISSTEVELQNLENKDSSLKLSTK